MGIFLVLMLIFSGCTGNTSGKTNGFLGSFGFGGSSSSGTTPEVDNTGNGLEVSFTVDTQNVKTGRLIYNFKIKNTGVEPITLTKENFVFKTIQSFKDKSILTDESIQTFYSKILGSSGSLTLYQNMEYESSGVMRIEPTFLDTKINPNIKNFDILLKIDYDYKTDFISNVEIGKKYDMHYIKSGGSFEQASPIQVNKIEIIPDVSDGSYTMYVTINDKGQRGDYSNLNDEGIVLNSFNIMFSQNTLSCQVKPDTVTSNSALTDFRLKTGKALVLECPLTISEKDAFVTQLTGSFDFKYDYLKQISISLPKDVNVDSTKVTTTSPSYFYFCC